MKSLLNFRTFVEKRKILRLQITESLSQIYLGDTSGIMEVSDWQIVFATPMEGTKPRYFT
jgi:hypothetical protein